MDYLSQVHMQPLSARVLVRKPTFNPRGNTVIHLTTNENWETNDHLCQANRFEDLFRPTSENFVPSIESQRHFSSIPSNSYQGNSTPVASSNRQWPTVFGTAHSPTSQSSQLNDETSSQSARLPLPTVDQDVSVGQLDSSGRPTIVTFNDASIIPIMEDLKLQALTDFRDHCNGSSVRPDQILSQIRPALEMTMTDLLIQDGVTDFTAEQNINWQTSIPPIEVINHLINIHISSGYPDDAILTVLRNVTIKFDFYDKYCVQETLTSIYTHIVSPLEHRLSDNSVKYKR